MPCRKLLKLARREFATSLSAASGLVVVGLTAPGSQSQDPLDGADKLFHREGLADVVANSQHLGIGAVAASFVAGDHDGGNEAARAALELLEHEEAALLGHHHVEDDQVRVLTLCNHQTRVAIPRDKDAIALVLQNGAHRFYDLVIVIDQEDGSLLRRHIMDSPRLRCETNVLAANQISIIAPRPAVGKGATRVNLHIDENGCLWK